MLIYHCVPKAGRRFFIGKLMRAFPRFGRQEYYEPMQVHRGADAGPLPILLHPGLRTIARFDLQRLRRIDFTYGVFASDKFIREPGDYAFTVIRHPVERFYSGYHHAHDHLAHGTETAQDGSGLVRYRDRFPEMAELFGLDLKAFVRRFLDCGGDIRFERGDMVYGPIRELFFLPSTLDQQDFVGVLELMDATLRRLNADLGTSIVNDGKVNAGPRRRRDVYGREALTELFADDIATYERWKAALAEAPVD